MLEDASHQPTRSSTIDILRGLALLVICSDHLASNLLSKLTPIATCYFDMTDVFLSLSGFVCGASVKRRITHSGRWASLPPIALRCTKLYAAHVATVICVTVIVGHLALQLNVSSVTSDGFRVLQQQPIAALQSVLALEQRASAHTILPIYIALLPGLLLLVLFARRPWLALILPICLYLANAWHAHGTTQLHQNLFPDACSWQLLFVGAAVIGYTGALRWSSLQRILASPGVMGCALVLFAALIVTHALTTPPPRRLYHPLRLLHLVPALVIACQVIRWPWIRKSGLLSVFEICGRHSLAVYCFGLGFSALLSVMVTLQTSALEWQILANLACWSLCYVVAKTCELAGGKTPCSRTDASAHAELRSHSELELQSPRPQST